MKNVSLTTLLLCLIFRSYSQLDYRDMKDSICPPKGFCGFRDSADLAIIYPKLQSLDTTTLSKGMAQYYYDLWEVEYELYARRHADTVFLRRSTNSAAKVLHHDPKDFHAMWNTALGYYRLHECDKAVYYLILYADHCPKKDYKKKEQIEYLLEGCPNEEIKKRFKIRRKRYDHYL